MTTSKPSTVYYTEINDNENISSVSDKLRNLIIKSGLLDALGKEEFTCIKLHFGEKGNTGYIKPEWVKVIADEARGKTDNIFLTDSNVLYKSNRSNSVDHLKLAYEHGFDMDRAGAPVIIADGIF